MTAPSFNRWDPLGDRETYSGPRLRKWQQAALAEWESASHSGVVEAITGTGKSMVGVGAVHEVLSLGGAALVMVPSRALVAQWTKTLRDTLPQAKIGQYSDGSKEDFSNRNVIVGTVQSLYKNPIRPRSLILLVADEVHRYGSEQYSKALRKDFDWRLGLSGTYERQQDDGLQRYLRPYFKEVIFEYGYGAALEDGTVSRFDLCFVETPLLSAEQSEYDLADEMCSDSRRKLIREFGFPQNWRDFFSAVTAGAGSSESDIVTDLCRRYMTGFSNRKAVLASAASKLTFVEKAAPSLDGSNGTLIFSETKASARRLAFVASKSVSAFPLDGDSKAQERESKLREFGVGRLKVLSAPRILDEGIDVPEAEVAMIASASQTKRQMIQRMGRVIRLKKSGGNAKIVMLFAPGTPEDPATGGHEAFLDEIRPHANSETLVRAGDLDSFKVWLSRP